MDWTRLVSATVSRTSTLEEIKRMVRGCLDELYVNDRYILDRNICERSIVFRFAYYLQKEIGSSYFVDCDFNSSFEYYVDSRGRRVGREKLGKPIENEEGIVVNRFVDIIVHKRDYQIENDFICFEIKKWNNRNQDQISKDKNNLRVLTSQYGYIYGFYISIDRVRTRTKWIIFSRGVQGQETLVFNDDLS